MASLEGNFQAQPRVFAHDMIPLAIGNVNPDGGLEMTAAGSTYSANDVIILSSGGGATASIKVKILTVETSGAIKTFEVTNNGIAQKPFGEGYVLGDTLNDTGAGVAAFTVKNIDIPYSGERGACIYAGIAIDNGLDLVLESDKLYNTTYTARLKGITAGSFLPVLAKRVVAVNLSSGTYGAGDLVAMY